MASQEFRVEGAARYDLRSPTRWIGSHVLRYPVLLLATIVGYTVSSALYSLTAVLIGQAFDGISRANNATQFLLSVALALLGVKFGQGLASLLGTFAIDILAHRVERDAREELFISLLGKSQTFHQRQRVGDVMARAINDIQQLNTMFNPGVRLIAESTLSVIAPLGVIAWLAPQLLLVPVSFLVVFTITAWWYNRWLAPGSMAQRVQFGQLNSRLAEVVSGIEVVRLSGQAAAEQARFAQQAQRVRDIAVRQGAIQAAYLPLLAYAIAFGLAFVHALLLLGQGAISVGAVIAFMGLFAQLRYVTLISGLSFALIQWGLAGAGRVLDLIRTESDLDENPTGYAAPLTGEIVFEHVSFGYADTPVVHDMSFRVRPGERVAIVGQTGSGKTTVGRLVNRTYDVSAGRILIDGVDVRHWNLAELRRQIATIEQDVFLFSRTVAENIAFGTAGKALPAAIKAAATVAQIHSFIEQLPDGYATLLGERGVNLSGGQRQRIALARALLTDPPILIVDDSTSAVDSATEDQILRAMAGVLQGRTTLMITNRLAQIRWADRILVLEDGALVAEGSHKTLLQTCPQYCRLFAGAEPLTVANQSIGSVD